MGAGEDILVSWGRSQLPEMQLYHVAASKEGYGYVFAWPTTVRFDELGWMYVVEREEAFALASGVVRSDVDFPTLSADALQGALRRLRREELADVLTATRERIDRCQRCEAGGAALRVSR